MGKRAQKDVVKGRLRVQDPFELIRWLALSQPDPRKALAELVQNSLDAGARKIRITRVRERKVPCLKILDDGEGVIPELSRPEALRYIATHVGHSRKRDLSPERRLALMTQGQYGIGLLGFWSLGDVLEIRSFVPGEKAYRLVLHRDRPEFEIEPVRRGRLFDERHTEVVVGNLTKEASAAMAARRASDYLAGELRGQLLGRDVEVVIEDKMARGRAPKLLHVRPPKFLGERIHGLGPIEVPDHEPIRLEIYLRGDGQEETAPVALYAAGTLVAESFSELGALGLDREPWTDRSLTGLVDFASLHIAPGSRRGVIPDAVAHAMAESLRAIEPAIRDFVAERERERAEELDRNVVRDLQRAFRDFYHRRPSYTMLPTDVKGGAGGEDAAPGVAASTEGEPDPETETLESEPVSIFPPGPLATVALSPKTLRVEPGSETRVRARALDGTGRTISEGVRFAWEVWGHVGHLREATSPGSVVTFVASDDVAEGILSVHASEVGSSAEATAAVPVEVAERTASGSDVGIPEPELVNHPSGSWRSRFNEGRWQVNTGHVDYQENAKRPALKLRYLAMLFAKEVVLRSSQDPRLEEPLEQLIEVTAYADRRLTEKPPIGRRRTKKRSTESS